MWVGDKGGKKENLISFLATAALWDESAVDDKPGIIYPALFALQIIILLSFREYKYVSKWGRLFILTTLVNMKFKVVENDINVR